MATKSDGSGGLSVLATKKELYLTKRKNIVAIGSASADDNVPDSFLRGPALAALAALRGEPGLHETVPVSFCTAKGIL